MITPIPEHITFQFSNFNGVDHGLVVYIVLESKQKNNFTIGPLLTDSDGQLIITRELIEEVISKSKKAYPMDYGGDINDCNVLKIIVETRSELKDRVARLKEFYPDSAKNLERLILMSGNGEKGLVKEINLPIDKNEIVLGFEHNNQVNPAQ